MADGFAAVAACGITRVGTVEDDVFELAVADWETFTFGEAELEEFKFGEFEADMLEFAETEELAIIDRLEIELDNLAASIFIFGNSAERTSLPAFAAGVTEVAGVAGLNCTRFWPRFVVLNCKSQQVSIHKLTYRSSRGRKEKWGGGEFLTNTEEIAIRN
jgi:hypothetical protein